MLHRIKKKSDVNAGKWIGIGGKFEDGESPEECLLREVYEETGLVPQNCRFRGIVTFDCPPHPTEYMHLFTASADSSLPLSECDEGELKWIPISDILSLPLWEGDRIFLDLLQREVPFFSLKLSYDGNTLVRAVLNGNEL